MRVLDALLMLVVVMMMFVNARLDVGEFGLNRLVVVFVRRVIVLVFVIMLVTVRMRAAAAVMIAVRTEHTSDLMQYAV